MPWSHTLDLHTDDYTVTVLNVEQSEGACIDSGAPVDVTEQEDEINLSAGDRVYLKGIFKDTIPAAPGYCRFPTMSADHKPVVIETRGKGLRSLPADIDGVDSNNPWKVLLEIPMEEEVRL
mmetsp:Transcript_30033/g.61845  ORF Transcript_30033/g.61845 Transcript_30033/m.61845 type:complete len:121 (-) Transcript_30033:235-597(-)